MINITKCRDNDGHWYWIPNDELDSFKKELEEITGIDYMDNPDKFDIFIEKYDKYRTLGDPNITPNFFMKNND